MKKSGKNKLPLRDSKGRFVSPSKFVPLRDSKGRFVSPSKFVLLRDSKGRFVSPSKKQKQKKQKQKKQKQKKQQKQRQPKPEQEQTGFDLCTPQGRRELYRKVSQDHDTILKESKQARRRGLFVYVNVGLKESKGKKKLVGERRFRDLEYFKRFLLLDRHGEKSGIDWSSDKGICRYEKTAGLAITASKGRRRVLRRIYKKYDIVQPKERKNTKRRRR